jgi:D-tyrosyl-tRNA(Tyr) deacylase
VGGRCLASALHSPVHGGRSEDTAKGNRPSFTRAARPKQAEPLYEAFCHALEAEQIEVARGIFGARMVAQIENQGPVTIVLET